MKFRVAALWAVCFLSITGCGARSPNGKYVARLNSPGGDGWIETADFRSNGVCYYGTPSTIAECQWSRNGKTITISRNGVVLSTLQIDGDELVDPATAPIRGPFIREP